VAKTLLALRDISVQYGNFTALQLSSLDVLVGEVLAVIGPNGAGKSTLLRVMGLLQQPTTGKVFFDGEKATQKNGLLLRRRAASVFQEPLLLNASVHDNVALGLRIRGLRHTEVEKRLRPWLERLDIVHLGSRKARTLSGGEAQRTSLARALALNPELLLLDEPFSALDPPTREGLLLDLQEILTETAVTTVLVTHDRHEAFMLGERIGVLKEGRLLQIGSNLDIFTRPLNEDVAEIVGMDTRLSGVVEKMADGMTTVRLTGGAVKVIGRFEPGKRVILCIRPEDISLCRLSEDQCPSDGMNHIRVRIVRVSPWMAQYRIVLAWADTAVTALIGKTSFVELCLRQGDEALASFSPTAVHIIGTLEP
jgi:tungstate transport system ATP-binding protein